MIANSSVDNSCESRLEIPSMKQLEFKRTKGWGGKRRGAGRPNRTGTVSHGKREQVDFRKPLNITIKIKEKTVNLRSQIVFNALVEACKKAKQFDYHVIQFSILRDHIHMIVEAKNNEALDKGTKSLHGRL